MIFNNSKTYRNCKICKIELINECGKQIFIEVFVLEIAEQ